MIVGNGAETGHEEVFDPPKPLPGPIADAIAAVQADIKRLTKGEQNDFGGYAFTSVDDIYELIGPLMAKAKLVIMPYELRRPKMTIKESPKGPKQIAEICVGFMLSVGSDSYADKHLCETLVIQIEGTQTFHAAKSYACKTFYRGLWKIPTGEPDHVDMSKQDGDDDKKAETLKKKPKVEKLAHPASEKKKAEIIAALKKFKKPLAPEDKDSFMETWGVHFDSLVPDHLTEVRTAYGEATKV
jgi:hypothetical protein